MYLLHEKLRPPLLQFPWFNKYQIQADEFFLRLLLFLKRIKDPPTVRFVAEIRNKAWLDKRFTDLLREHNVALALTDLSNMPRPWEVKNGLDLVATDFVYVRWLGDRKGIEALTATWDKTIIDRTDDLKKLGWVIPSVFDTKPQSLRLRQQSLRRAWAGHSQVVLEHV